MKTIRTSFKKVKKSLFFSTYKLRKILKSDENLKKLFEMIENNKISEVL